MNSPEFKATDVQKSFLTFVVESFLAGRSHEIKGYTIATQVFGRGEDFSQATDPIVSIQANKLRRAIERYYLVAGQNDPIHIEIPKGTCVPIFRATSHRNGAQPFQKRRKTDAAPTFTWPTTLVESFENLTGNQEMGSMGVGVATEIALEITRYQEIRVLRQRPEKRQRRASDISARFVLRGSIKKGVKGVKLIVNLIDGLTGIHIWGDHFLSDLDPDELIQVEENVTSTVVSKISSECGVIAKLLSPESKRVPPEELTTYEAMLHFYRFENEFSTKMYLSSLAALQQSCKNEPEYGLAWSMLARLYALNFSLEFYEIETPLENAAVFAEKGVFLEPANQRVRMIMAFILLLNNQLSEGLTEVDRAQRLNPNSLILLDNIGYLMTLFGDWQRGPAFKLHICAG